MGGTISWDTGKVVICQFQMLLSITKILKEMMQHWNCNIGSFATVGVYNDWHYAREIYCTFVCNIHTHNHICVCIYSYTCIIYAYMYKWCIYMFCICIVYVYMYKWCIYMFGHVYAYIKCLMTLRVLPLAICNHCLVNHSIFLLVAPKVKVEFGKSMAAANGFRDF